MLFLSVTVTQPNDLPILPFACTTCTAHGLHLSQRAGHGGQLLSPSSEGFQPKAHQNTPLPFGVGMGWTPSLQPAEAAPRCIGRPRITGADRDSTCTLSYRFEKSRAHASVPFSGFEVILTKKSSP